MRDKFEMALRRIQNADPRVVRAAVAAMPTPFEIDTEEHEAFAKLLLEIANSALNS